MFVPKIVLKNPGIKSYDYSFNWSELDGHVRLDGSQFRQIFCLGVTHFLVIKYSLNFETRHNSYFTSFLFCVGGRLRGWMNHSRHEREFYSAHFETYVGFQNGVLNFFIHFKVLRGRKWVRRLTKSYMVTRLSTIWNPRSLILIVM